VFSLGNSSTCITSNDVTGLNGAFQLILPAVTTSLAVQNQNASQNYINSIPPGTPIAGDFRITLTTNFLDAPLTVSIALSGTGIQGTHYTVNNTNDGTGIQITPATVTFPAGNFTGVGNFFADVTITPTATPLFTNTLTATLQVLGNAAYLRSAPVIGTVNIQNTGPQILLMAANPGATSMYRGTTNDYAQFTLTRLGDTNGPGNSAAGVTPHSYTITNFVLKGTAVAPGNVGADYTAGPQVWNPVGTPTDTPSGNYSLTIPAGATVLTNVVGNPRYNGDIYAKPVDVTVVLSMTNKLGGADVTNQLSSEGLPYAVIINNVASMTILDNRLGPEVVLWSNPLTNSADAGNWTAVFDATNLNVGNITNALPYVAPASSSQYPNYDGVHDFNVTFGYDPSTEAYGPVPLSPIMVASNWSTVLKMTVNKDGDGAPAGLNLYPTGQNFGGNYALRFNMYLSTEQDSINNPFVGTLNREFATFGMNHYGTNANWRINPPINNRVGNGGNDRTNQDGIWFTVDAGTGSQTPADFDGFQGAPIPNRGWAVSDTVSSLASVFKGNFKSPPFPAEIPFSFDPNNVGGQPVDQWVDVSMEINNQTNCTLFVNKTKIFNMLLTNIYISGDIMLGYLDPVKSQGDPFSSWVYYSNVRAVELSPFMNIQTTAIGAPAAPTNYWLVAQGSSLTFTSSATFASAPITNKWFRGTGGYSNATPGTPMFLLQSNAVNATSFADSFTKTFNVIADATNYMNVYSDAAGSVTSRVFGVEVVFGPTNQNFAIGSNSRLITTVAGVKVPNQFQWYFNNTVSNFSTATLVAASSHYGTPTTGTLWLTNVTAADAGYYWLAATNSLVTNSTRFVVTPAGQIGVGNAASGLVVAPTPQTVIWGSNATFTVTASGDSPFTYVWKKGATVLANSAHIGGATSSAITISNVTFGDAGAYTAAVSNSFGGATANGVITEYTPTPRITGVGLAGGNVGISFTTTNGFDSTTTFTLQAEGSLNGINWTNVAGTSYSGDGQGNFQVTAPQDPTAPQLFYRVIHN
jgi:hypothetical protein